VSLTDLKALIDIASGLNTPLLGLLAWLVWRLYSNHLPHIEKGLDSIDRRLARLEGRQEERDNEHTRGTW
jgi:hypothetical protein